MLTIKILHFCIQLRNIISGNTLVALSVLFLLGFCPSHGAKSQIVSLFVSLLHYLSLSLSLSLCLALYLYAAIFLSCILLALLVMLLTCILAGRIHD